MQHPFEILRPEYEKLLGQMVVTRPQLVDSVARRLVGYWKNGDYGDVSDKTGIPIIFMATSFEREASSDFRRSPAQGDFWNRVSIHVPKHRGPFGSWREAALDAYGIDHMDAVGADNWTWARLCYEEEAMNGFGYRDFHRMHSPYVWGASNIQQPGKYTSDGQFDPSVMDTQLGTIPLAMRMAQLAPELSLPDWPFPSPPTTAAPVTPVVPMPAPVGIGGGNHGPRWIQHALNALDVFGDGTKIGEDGSYGKETRHAVEVYQTAHNLGVDGLAGPETIGALVADMNSRGLA